jgi:hypothetical protein
VTIINTRIKNTNPESPKTKPESGLFSRKAFPLTPGTPVEGEAVSDVVCVIVVGPFGWLVGSGGVSVRETGNTVELEVIDEGGMDDVERVTLDVVEDGELRRLLGSLIALDEGELFGIVEGVGTRGDDVAGGGEVCEVVVPVEAVVQLTKELVLSWVGEHTENLASDEWTGHRVRTGWGGQEKKEGCLPENVRSWCWTRGKKSEPG